MAVGSDNSQMPHHLLRWAQMSFPAFVSPLVPLTAPAKAFRHLLSRTWILCQVPPPPQELQIENPLCHIKKKMIIFLPTHRLLLRCSENSTAEFRKAQLLLLSRTDTAPSEASTNRQGSKSTVRTGTTNTDVFFSVLLPHVAVGRDFSAMEKRKKRNGGAQDLQDTEEGSDTKHTAL